MITETEVFKWVAGYENIYEVGDQGTVRSVPRLDMAGRPLQGGVLRPGRSLLTRTPYFTVKLSGKEGPRKCKLVSRLVAEAFIPRSPDDGCFVDHINGDTMDNRADNLRWVTHIQNLRAFQAPRKRGLSRFRGVSKSRQRWNAAITATPAKRKYLCSFDTEEEAALAYNKAAVAAGFLPEALNHIPTEALK